MQFPKEFELLAKIEKQIQFEQKGLAYLENTDQIMIVCLEGDAEPITGDIVRSNSSSTIKRFGNSIWISTKPIYNKKIKKSIVFLKTNITNDEGDALEKIHFLCSLISNIVMVFNYEQTRLRYLVNISDSERGQAQKRRQKMSMLVGAKYSPYSSAISKNVEDFYNELKKQGIENDVSLMYSHLSGFNFPSNPTFSQFTTLIEGLYDSNQAINQLMHGPILTSYTFNLVNQINETGKVNIEQAQQSIEINDEYAQYLRTVEDYHKKGASKLGTQPQNDINGILKQIRKDTEDGFQCNDGVYLKKLNNYIERKQGDIKSANEELHERKNIKILQKQSEKCIKRIREKDSPTHDNVERQLDRLNTVFDRDAGGQNKQKLFTDYIKMFTPTLYKQAGLDHDPDRKIKKLNEENKKLAEQIKQLQKKQDKCCAIM